MIVCPNCQHRNPPGRTHCSACGRSLEKYLSRVCPTCGALNEAANQYCHRCLSDLDLPTAETPPAQGEAAPQLGETPVAHDVPQESDSPAHKDAPIAPDGLDSTISDERLAPAFLVPEGAVQADSEQPGPDLNSDQELAWLAQEGDVEPADSDRVCAEPVDNLRADEDSADIDGDAQDGPADQRPPENAQDDDDDSLAPYRHPTRVVKIADADLVKPQVLASLEDLRHAIPIETAVALPHRARPHRATETPEIERRDASLFQKIATEPASLAVPAHTLITEDHKPSSRWATVLLNMLVLVAVILPPFTRGISQNWAAPRPQVVAAATAISDIPRGETVLVAFDYTPAFSGELDPMALAVIRQLARQSCRIVAVSTEPEGIPLANEVLGTVAREGPGLEYGTDYVVLGYIAGESAGLRALGKSASAPFRIARPLTKDNVPILGEPRDELDPQNVNHAIILCQESQTVRHWIEQVQAPTGWALHAFVCTRIAPVLAPYKQSGQLATLLGAADSLVEYEIAADVRSSQEYHNDGQAVVVVLVLLIAVVANAFAIVQGSRKTVNRDRA